MFMHGAAIALRRACLTVPGVDIRPHAAPPRSSPTAPSGLVRSLVVRVARPLVLVHGRGDRAANVRVEAVARQ